jgi:hypothetical protein
MEALAIHGPGEKLGMLRSITKEDNGNGRATKANYKQTPRILNAQYHAKK